MPCAIPIQATPSKSEGPGALHMAVHYHGDRMHVKHCASRLPNFFSQKQTLQIKYMLKQRTEILHLKINSSKIFLYKMFSK